ncbi:hypothetical protein [Psychrobacter communis]|nr:hypothetical protein [Psychrobacter communis]
MSSDRSKLTIQTTSYAHLNAGIVIIGAGMAGSRFAIELARARQQSQSSNNQR